MLLTSMNGSLKPLCTSRRRRTRTCPRYCTGLWNHYAKMRCNVLWTSANLVFPTKTLEAKELHASGHRIGWILSRQTHKGESMLSYISRRRRWYCMMLEMVNSLSLSADIRGDQLLENSGLSKAEKLMILASMGNL